MLQPFRSSSACRLRLISLVIVFIPCLAAQEAHWGVQGDFFRGQAASFIVDKIDEIERQDPTINADVINGGIVRSRRMAHLVSR